MEELRQGGEMRDFCRTIRVGSTVHILQWRGNTHGRFLVLLEFGNGGRRTFVIISKGREGSGWANCLAQLRKLEKFFTKTDDGENKGGKIQTAQKMEMKPANHGGWTFAAVLIRQGHDQEKGTLSRGYSGEPRDQALSILARAEKETKLVDGDHLVNVVEDGNYWLTMILLYLIWL
jgi:hypothetical protein